MSKNPKTHQFPPNHPMKPLPRETEKDDGITPQEFFGTLLSYWLSRQRIDWADVISRGLFWGFFGLALMVAGEVAKVAF